MRNKVDDARTLLKELGLPEKQQTEIAAYTLLALGAIGKSTAWRSAQRRSLRIHDIKEWIKETYAKSYAENTRETFRRQVLHQLEQARVVERNPDSPGLSTNSPRTHYALSEDALRVIRSFGSSAFKKESEGFQKRLGSLVEVYQPLREGPTVPVVLPSGERLILSPGEHNQLQRDIVEKFAPAFAPGARLLYLGDTAKKHLHVEIEALKALEIPITKHDKLPDLVLHLPERGWLMLIEAVTSHGPVSPKRKHELDAVLKDCPLTRIYVSAFPSFTEFKRHLNDIAWETEVWVAEIPDHMIHFNGEKFLAPLPKPT